MWTNFMWIKALFSTASDRYYVFSHFQNVKEGMLMLGSVKEVTDFEVTVSLPCGLQGFLSIKNICDSYTKLLSEQLDSADTEVGLWSVDSVRLAWRARYLGFLFIWYAESSGSLDSHTYSRILL